jgi:hypothetical protein
VGVIAGHPNRLKGRKELAVMLGYVENGGDAWESKLPLAELAELLRTHPARL